MNGSKLQLTQTKTSILSGLWVEVCGRVPLSAIGVQGKPLQYSSRRPL